jgi:uncharacterized protein (DUF305 family)
MKNNIPLIVIISVLIGLGGGYVIRGEATGKDAMQMSSKSAAHMMPDGTMMGGSMTMESMMADMMSNLKGKTGVEFDKAFLSEMIMHHEGAVVMSQAVLTSTKRPELIALAKNIISAQTTEIKMMKDWQKMWFNNNR